MSMQTTDPIADLLTRIRNAKLVGKTEVRVPSSKMKKVIAEQLVKNGYLADVKLEDAKPRGVLVVTINEKELTALSTKLPAISKPGRRVYVGASEIPKVKEWPRFWYLSQHQKVS